MSDLIYVVVKDKDGNILGSLDADQFMKAMQMPKNAFLDEAVKKYNNTHPMESAEIAIKKPKTAQRRGLKRMKNPRARWEIIRDMRSVRMRQMPKAEKDARLASLKAELEATPKAVEPKAWYAFRRDGSYAGKLEATTKEEAEEEAAWFKEGLIVRNMTYSELQKMKNPTRRKNPFNPNAKMHLTSLTSEIYEDSYEEGEGAYTGAGLNERLSKTVDSLEQAIKYLDKGYGLSSKLQDYDIQEDADRDVVILQTSRMVADHSDAQNGGWMEPTDKEFELWKKGKMKLYVENLTVTLHQVAKLNNPLVRGRGKKSVGKNIKTLMREGYPQKQAIAIALNKAGLSRRKNPSIGETVYIVSKKETKKIPITSDTADIVASLLESGKYAVPSSLEDEMYRLFDKYGVFYRVIRRNPKARKNPRKKTSMNDYALKDQFAEGGYQKWVTRKKKELIKEYHQYLEHHAKMYEDYRTGDKYVSSEYEPVSFEIYTRQIYFPGIYTYVRNNPATDLGKVPHSELAMHSRVAGKRITSYNIVSPHMAEITVEGDHVPLRGTHGEVLSHEIKEMLSKKSKNPKTSHSNMTIQEFKQALRNGPYAWPGGYPIYFVTADGDALSFKAAKENSRLIMRAIRDGENTGGWRVIGSQVNWEDNDAYCAHTGEKIECAYPDDKSSKAKNPKSKSRKFDLGAGHLGNGIKVWNRARQVHGDYETIAHINHDRTIKYYIKNPPQEVVEYVESIAKGPNRSVSTSQPDQKVFSESAYKCPDCGSDQDLLAGIMGGVCGACVRKRHKKAMGGKVKNPGVTIDKHHQPTVMTMSEAKKVAKANNADESGGWTYEARALDKPKGMAVVEVQDENGEVLGYL